MTDPFCAQGWVLKSHLIPLFYHGKVMKKNGISRLKRSTNPVFFLKNGTFEPLIAILPIWVYSLKANLSSCFSVCI